MTSRNHILSTIKANRNGLERLGVSDVGLFGSYATDRQSESSDIDILIDFRKGEDRFDNLMAVCDLFEDLFKGERVEVVTKNGLSPYIGPRILKEVVYV